MKWLQISCILIIFAFGLIHADSKSNEEDDDCYMQYRNQSDLVNVCIKQLINESEFFNELHTTLVGYSGDNVAVHALSDKYCPILQQMLQCTLMRYDVDKECQIPLRLAENKLIFESSSALLNYLCANSSAVLVRILENNGLETIYENEKFNQCFKLIDRVENIDDETLGPSAALCDGVDKVLECYSNLVREHENKNLIEIAKELHAIFRQATKCNSTNELKPL